VASLTLEELKALPEDQQKELYNKLKAVRKKAKVVSYSAMYGIGAAKLARTLNTSKKEAQTLLDGFWKLNWAIKAVADRAEIKVTGPYMWVKNPVSGFWINLRTEKDVWSSLNQSTGVYAFDTWLAYVRASGVVKSLEMHDEIGFYLPKGQEEKYEEGLRKAIDKTNDKLNLNVKLDIDVQFGRSYSDTH
jgi:DNA polymerase I-like protein with 3'-5' exonuclease and polymerase domains